MKCCEKHGQVMRLIVHDESQETRVYARDKTTIRGRKLLGDCKIFVKGGPHYNVESSTDSKSVFISKANNNQPFGLLRDGVLDGRQDLIAKEYFFHKLGLAPSDPKRPPSAPFHRPRPASATEPGENSRPIRIYLPDWKEKKSRPSHHDKNRQKRRQKSVANMN